jgi:hypothetical protein
VIIVLRQQAALSTPSGGVLGFVNYKKNGKAMDF